MAEVSLPFKGIHKGGSFRNQPPFTTPDCKNIRAFSKQNGRLSITKRSGLEKAYTTQLASGKPVLRMLALNTTYIKPG